MEKPRLLAGGNPQIPKGEGDAPVQAYIDAIPGWKQHIARAVDEIVDRAVPDVRKAVKWNSPLYGVGETTWFLGFHCFEKYVKLSFFQGALLDPVPPGQSKQPEVRYLDIREDDVIDEERLSDWFRQASRLTGVKM